MLDQLGEPDATFGAPRERPRAAGTLGDSRALPAVRAWDRPSAPGLVRVEPEQPVRDRRRLRRGARRAGRVRGRGQRGRGGRAARARRGRGRRRARARRAGAASEGAAGGPPPGGDAAEAGRNDGAGGGAGVSAFGAGGLAYAGDVTPAQIAAADEVVITDSNRRRVLVPSRLAQNAGPVLSASEEPSVDAAVLNPFAALGADAQTVAVHDGIAAVTAPSSPGFPQFPENRPFAALDGDETTQWQADRALLPERHALSVTFDAPRDIDTLELLPYNDRRATVEAVEVQGRRFPVEPGWNRLAVDLKDVKTLTVRIAGAPQADGRDGGRGRDSRAAHRRAARARGAAAADHRRALRGAGRRAHVPVPAHDRRRPVPPHAEARPGGRGARARPPRRRNRHHARLQSAHRADVHGRRLGERRGHGPRRRARPPRRRPGGLHELRALPGEPRLPRLERVRRHTPAVARRLPRGPHDLDRVERRGADDRLAHARSGPWSPPRHPRARDRGRHAVCADRGRGQHRHAPGTAHGPPVPARDPGGRGRHAGGARASGGRDRRDPRHRDHRPRPALGHPEPRVRPRRHGREPPPPPARRRHDRGPRRRPPSCA